MKTIVTHMRPDMDALTSSWMVRRFMPGWTDAQLAFVKSGETLNGMDPTSDSDIIHVDTGKGPFDHHQFKEKLSASIIVFRHLDEHQYVKGLTRNALSRLADFATVIDNFGEMYFPDPTADVYDFTLPPLIDSLGAQIADDHKLAEMVFVMLDAELALLKDKIVAEDEIAAGIEFVSPAGKSLGVLTSNEQTVKLAQKKGFVLVVKKDPANGYLRIKVAPESPYLLNDLYKSIKKDDPDADWFLHASGHMLLNGSSKNPGAKPSSLTLEQAIDLINHLSHR